MKDCFIQGELVYLRVPDIQKDVIEGDWHEWFNDDNITRFLYHGVYPNSLEKQVEIVKNNLEKDNMLLLSIIEKKTHRMVGVISLKDIDLLNRVAEITIVMGKEKYVPAAPLEAMALLTSHGFNKLNLNKIQAGQHIGLWKWVNTLELIGYKLEGYIKETHIRNSEVSSSVRVGITSLDYYKLLRIREGKYLTSNLKELLKNRRKENMCLKLSHLIDGLYE